MSVSVALAAYSNTMVVRSGCEVTAGRCTKLDRRVGSDVEVWIKDFQSVVLMNSFKLQPSFSRNSSQICFPGIQIFYYKTTYWTAFFCTDHKF